MKKAIDDRPPVITPAEIRLKLGHLCSIVAQRGYDAVKLESEGAMRWLTGRKHQVADIAPAAPSPVNALIKVNSDDSIHITFTTKPFEMPRVRDEIIPFFENVENVNCELSESTPSEHGQTLYPYDDDYREILDAVVRPLLGEAEANPYCKLEWLSKTSMLAMAETALSLTTGMTGLQVRALLLQRLALYGIDANLTLIALAGQHQHLHPIAADDYKVAEDCWLKLVTGSRFAEHIVSQSLMVKLGGTVTDEETAVYHALQDAAVEYADCYREGESESKIHSDMMERFKKIEKLYELDGFAESATLHHPGGGTSPLGNRDRLLNPNGNLILDAWTQFAINPVDVIKDFKVELQGVVQPNGKPPLLLNMDEYAQEKIPFRSVKSTGGSSVALPELVTG